MSRSSNEYEVLKYHIETPDGTLNGSLSLPVGQQLRLGELAWNALTLTDRLVGLSLAREAKGERSISCTKGCGACCRQVVPVSVPEAYMLMDILSENGGFRMPQARTRFLEIEHRLDQMGMIEPLMNGAENHQELVELGHTYFQQNLACPFLEDESCGIHPLRPSMCREYLVTSPPEWCSVPLQYPIQRVPVSGRLSEALARLTAELLDRPIELIPLTLVPRWMRTRGKEANRSWPGLELMRRLLTLMSRR